MILFSGFSKQSRLPSPMMTMNCNAGSHSSFTSYLYPAYIVDFIISKSPQVVQTYVKELVYIVNNTAAVCD